MYVELKRAHLGTSDFRPVPVAVSCFACFYSLRTGCELKVSRFCADIKHWVKYWQIFLYEDFHSLENTFYFVWTKVGLKIIWYGKSMLIMQNDSKNLPIGFCEWVQFARLTVQLNKSSFLFLEQLSILVMPCISEKWMKLVPEWVFGIAWAQL